jgi:hypothetical protein
MGSVLAPCWRLIVALSAFVQDNLAWTFVIGWTVGVSAATLATEGSICHAFRAMKQPLASGMFQPVSTRRRQPESNGRRRLR